MVPVINIGSEVWCRQAYLNYHCYGNTMGLTPVQMGQICGAWSDRVESWQDSVTTDETEYVFDDSDYDEFIEQGKKDAADNVGHNGKKGGDLAEGIASNAVNVAVGLQTGIGAATGGLETSSGAGISELGKNTPDSFKTAYRNNGNGTDSSKKLKGDAGLAIATALNIATAAMYLAKKPNKESKEACDKLQGEMTDAQSTLTGAQSDMCGYAEEVATLSDEAFEYNEETNEEIEDQKADYDFYLKTYEALVAKIEAGEPLDDEEKELYKYCVELLGQIGANIDEIAEDNTEEVNDINDDMAGYQSEYDTVAEKMGNIEGLTDFAEGFDKNTKNMCIMTSFSQGINAASSAVNAARWVAQYGWWGLIGAVPALAAAAISGVGAVEQGKWAGEVSNEIALREGTQDLNDVTHEVYDEEIDYYAGMMEGVEDLEMVVPDDVEAPEDAPNPDVPTEDPDDPKKKPMAQ